MPARHITYRCSTCGSSFKPRRKESRFCSRLCASQAGAAKTRGVKRSFPQFRTGETLTCPTCQTEFYAQRAEIRTGRRYCSRKCKPNDHGWKGDDIKVESGHSRARRRFALGPCERCGEPGLDRHHVDGNTAHNEPENVQVLCRRCHMKADGRLEQLRTRPRLSKVTPEQVREIRQRVAEGELQRDVAADYPLHPSEVSRIVNRKRAADVV